MRMPTLAGHEQDERRIWSGFPTVFGRNLVEELNGFVHRPFLVVTMEDLWPLFEGQLDRKHCSPYIVRSVDEADLLSDLAALPTHQAIVGLGGGQALDAAKYLRLERASPALPDSNSP